MNVSQIFYFFFKEPRNQKINKSSNKNIINILLFQVIDKLSNKDIINILLFSRNQEIK